MGVLGGIAVGVVIFLLWRILKTQQTRTDLEATRVAVEAAKNIGEQIVRKHGSWAEARREGRLIEYLDDIADSLGLSVHDVRDGFETAQGARDKRDLLNESMRRGVHSRFLERHDYLDEFLPEFELDPFETELVCEDECDESWVIPGSSVAVHLESEGLEAGAGRLYLPEGYRDECPFCGGSVEWWGSGERDDVASKHRAGRETWRRYKKLFPNEAARDEELVLRSEEDYKKYFEAILAFYKG